MSRSSIRRQFLFVAALATLLLRALTPEGYMPGSPDSGLLYELCPDGMPAEIMQTLAGGGHHHHHHGHGDEPSVSATEQCPIGHMLASAVAVDVSAPLDIAPDASLLVAAVPAACQRRQVVDYRSRSPPA